MVSRWKGEEALGKSLKKDNCWISLLEGRAIVFSVALMQYLCKPLLAIKNTLFEGQVIAPCTDTLVNLCKGVNAKSVALLQYLSKPSLGNDNSL